MFGHKLAFKITLIKSQCIQEYIKVALFTLCNKHKIFCLLLRNPKRGLKVTRYFDIFYGAMLAVTVFLKIPKNAISQSAMCI